MDFALLFTRSLGSDSIDSRLYSIALVNRLRIMSTALASLSIIADLVAIHWFARMKRKWRHTLVILLFSVDILKAANFIALNSYYFITGSIESSTPLCQTSGFLQQYFTETSDYIILAIVVHMSLQVLRPSMQADSEGGLAKWKKSIISGVLGFPFIMACIPFSNHNGGYQLVGPFCSLPLRPFWYRLMLSWVPRYIITIVLVVLTIIVRLRVRKYQRKLAELQVEEPIDDNVEEGIIEEEDEVEESDQGSADANQKTAVQQASYTDEKEAVRTSVIHVPSDMPPMPKEHHQFDADDLRKYKRMSYKRHRLTLGGTQEPDRRFSEAAFSVAPSSAILASPTRVDAEPTRQASQVDDTQTTPAQRRKSVAGGDFVRRSQLIGEQPGRRASVMDLTTSRPESMSRNSFQRDLGNHGPDRMSSIYSTGLRSSIWDEIDASLEKKITNNSGGLGAGGGGGGTNANRLSVLTINLNEQAGAHHVESVSYASDFMAGGGGGVVPAPITQPPPSLRHSRSYAGSMRRASFAGSVGDLAGGLGVGGGGAGEAGGAGPRSRLSSVVRRSMSVMSLRFNGSNEDVAVVDNSPAARLRRRHRYIERQLRYLMVYPMLYLLIWLFPFIVHVLQYQDRFAVDPPFALVTLAIASIMLFGTVNSVVFCAREKPWTTIPTSDGTVMGSLRTFPPLVFLVAVWYQLTGREDDDAMDFQG